MAGLKFAFKIVLGVFFIAAGLNHFRNPRFYVSIMPPALPWPLMLVYLSGVAEILLGATVMVPSLQRPAAWGLILLLLAVFPANLFMATHPERFPQFPEWALWARLPLQAVMIAWAWWYTR